MLQKIIISLKISMTSFGKSYIYFLNSLYKTISQIYFILIFQFNILQFICTSHTKNGCFKTTIIIPNTIIRK